MKPDGQKPNIGQHSGTNQGSWHGTTMLTNLMILMHGKRYFVQGWGESESHIILRILKGGGLDERHAFWREM